MCPGEILPFLEITEHGILTSYLVDATTKGVCSL